jgi:UDP:flavonoid glycosyltransferase YjiC (YdhE family)
MARILLAWEMGANMGHIDRLLALARVLRTRGHDMFFVLRDLSRAHPRLVSEGFAIGQAPVWLPRLANPPRLNNYAAVLASAGWLDAQGLAGLVTAWRTWFDLLQPDLLVCDHAPTALLAARGRALPVWCVGTGFELPPTGEGFFPSFAAGNAQDRAACPLYDRTVLAPTNTALALLNEPLLARLTDIFAPAHKALTSLPELAHYDGYGDEVRWAGPSYIADSGQPPAWPAGTSPRVFVYLDPGHAEFNDLMAALKAGGQRCLVYAKGLAPLAATRLAGPQLRFVDAPLRLDQTLADADLAISHGGHGTVAAAALAGKPQLLLPNHAEQTMSARRLVAAGLALAAEPNNKTPAWGRLLREATAAGPLRSAAREWAARHDEHTPQRTSERLADWLEASLLPPQLP